MVVDSKEFPVTNENKSKLKIKEKKEKKRLELNIFRTRKPIREGSADPNVSQKSTLRQFIVPIKKTKSTEQCLSTAKVSTKIDVSHYDNSESFSLLFDRSGEPRTQSITMKSKREHECFAVASMEAPVMARESVNKTIIVGIPEKQIVRESAELNISEPKAPEKDCALENEEGNLTNAISEGTTKLVEHQLQEISKQAVELARSVKRECSSKEIVGESVIMTTSDSSSSIHLDTTGKTEKQINRIHECPSIPHTVGPNPSLEVRPDVRRMVATIGTDKRSMVDRLSRGLADLTSGSQDRLQRWKSKLQHTERKHKDVSEPPPVRRNMFLPNSNSSELTIDWTTNGTSQSVHRPRALHTSKSLQNASSVGNVPSLHNQLSLDMEHRTLKSKENKSNSQRNVFGTMPYNGGPTCLYKNDDMPQPTRIMPFSGLRPVSIYDNAEGDLIKPIAFRPMTRQNFDVQRMQSANNNSTSRNNLQEQPVNSLTSVPAVPTATVPSGPNIVRPKGMYQPSTSFGQSPPMHTIRPFVENEYDTVPELYENQRNVDERSNGSDYNVYHGSTFYSKQSNGSGSQHSSVGSPANIVNKQKSFNSSSSSSASRHSSGVHVTPSPSDSGIVDYESVIRDKENELREVRTTMEQNEEIIVKVYQEKERNYKDGIANLKGKLAASEKGENALRSQLSSCQRQTESMRVTIEGIRNEKNELMRRCAQLERDLNVLKNERSNCSECASHRRSLPAPRNTKECTPSDDLRDEVSQLRREVSTLKDALANVTLLNNNIPNDRQSQSSSDVHPILPNQSKGSLGRDRLI